MTANFESRGVCRPGPCYEYHCYGSGAATYLSATAKSRSFGKLVGQADLSSVRSAFIRVGLGAGAIKLYISHSSAVRSSKQTDVFVEKDAGFPLLVYGP